MKKIKLMALLLVSMLSINLWGADEPQTLLSFSRSGSSDSYTTGYTLTKAVEGKTDYYQDGSGDVRYLQLKQTSVLFSSAPTSVTVEATLGGGTAKDPLTNNVYACFVDKDGNNITGSAVTLTTKITNTTGSSFSASMSTSLATSAYGLKIYHQKENGYNVRYYSFSLKYIKATDPSCTSTLTAPEVTATPGDKQIVLTWDAVTDATEYKIFKNTAEVGTTTNTTYTLTGLTNKTSYAWQVVAIGNGTTICDSEPASGYATPNAVYTLNYSIAGEAGSVNATDGSNIVASLPSSPASCSLESNVFQGWTTAGSVLADGSDFIPVSGNVDATAASKTYTAVWAKEIIGEEESIAGGDMSNGAPDAWSKYGVDKYSNNGVKFDGANDSIASPDLSKNNAKSVTVKMKAGHNKGSGSVLTISAWSQNGKLIDSKTCTPTEAYTSQQTVYEYTLSGSDVIAKVSVKMTSKTNNLGMKYCEVFAKEVTCSKYITYCCEEHNVTLTNNGTKTGGSFSADIVKACEGTKITLSYNEATGYEFKGWTITPNTIEVNENNEFYMSNTDVTIDANFSLISYQISYDLADGAWVDESQVAKTYTYGTGATLPTADDITKANNTFLGWFLNNEGDVPTTVIGTSETGNKSFTARWLASGAKNVTISGDDKLTYTTFKPTTVDKDAENLTIDYSIEKGYTISTVTVAVDGNALTAEGEVVFSDEQLVIAPKNGFSGDVTIAFILMNKMFTVTWMANKTQFKQEEIQEGNKVTLPATNPVDVTSGEDTYTFQGWIAEEQYSNETTAPAYITNNTIEPTGDVTYYAVYAILTPGSISNNYAKITAKTDLVEDGQYIIASGSKALNCDVYQNYYLTATSVTVSNDKITNTNAKLVWTIEDINDGDVLFKSNDNGNYLQIINAGSGHYNLIAKNNDDDNANKSYFTPSVNSGNWTLKSRTNSSYYVSYYSNYNEFTTNTTASDLQIYKRQNNPDTYKNYRTRVAVIDHIAVNGTPAETKFVAGETFDATDLTIDVYYKDEVEPTNVTTGFTYAPNGTLATSNDKITFTYQGKTVDLTISVSNTVSGIEVTTNPTKMEYNEGEQFNPAGMVVTATYDNSAERDVTGYDYEPKGDLALGDKITISFGEQTTDLNITINEATKTTVNWYVEGVKLTEGEQSTAVIPGKKVTVLPTEPEACQGNQFVGWTAVDANYYNATTAPTDLFKTLADAPTIGETETNFYAVFASEAVGTYDEKVTLTALDAPIADKFTYAFAKLSDGNSNPSWNAEQAKAYVKNTLTVASKNDRIITKIEYTYNINKNDKGTAPSGATVTGNNSDNGSWDADNKTWTSSTNAATTVTLTVNGSAGNYGFTAIKVYLTGGTVLSDYSTTCLAALANPTITTAEGEYCGSVDVEITQPAGNPEGAKIMYSTDNTNWNEYEAAVNITTSGTVYAKVVKDPKETEVVSATYTVYPAYTLAQAATAASATSQIACLTFTDLLVQARTLSEAFLKASDGQIVLLNKSSHGLQVGDKLVANDAHVTFVKAHDLLQLTSTEGIAATTGNTTTPEEKAITALVAADYGQLVKIMDVTYDATNKKFTDVSSNEIAVDAKFFPSGIPTSWPDGGKFNVTGIVLTNSDNVVIAPRNTDDLESLATPLDKPTNFAVASVNSYQASYSWTAVDGNNGYTLYIYDGDNQVYKSNTIGSTRTDYAPTTALTANHTYTAKLVALGDKAISSDSPAAEVTFTTNPNAKLNWYVGDDEEPYATTYASQEKVVLPETDPTSPCPTNYENFVTWYNEEIDGQITALEASKKVKAGDAAASETTVKEYNFYAVFGKIKTAGTDKYVKVTEAQDNWKGEYLIGYDEGDDKDALTVFNGSLTTLDATSDYETISFESDGSIAVNATNNGYNFKIEKSATEGYYTIQSASGIYIANTTAKNGMSESSTTAYKNTISWGERVDIVTGENATVSHLGFNSASDQLRFRYYTSDSYANLVLYKRTKTNPQYSGYITTCPQTYTITIAENAKGLVEAATTTEILEGAKVQLTATANAGYTKTGGNWIVKNTETKEVVEGLVGGTNYLTMPAYDVTVDYDFQEIKDQFVDNLHGNTTIEKGGANYELPVLSDFSETTGKPSDNFTKFIGWSATSYDSGEPATEQPTILEDSQTATGATYFAVWYNGSGKYITEYCQTPTPTNLHLVAEYHKATSVRIDWNNVDGADKYHIIVMDGETEIIADADVTESVYDLSGLTPGATYDCTVKAHKDCWSDESEAFEFTTKENIQSYAVTINAEGGTYEIDPELVDGKIQEGATVTITNIAPTDADHYFFKELTVPEATDLIEDEGTYMFTMPGKAVTINIVFAAYPTITWKMAGVTDVVTSSVRQDNKFVVGTVQSAPANWKYKTYFPEFAGWVTSDNCDADGNVTIAEFISATTEVPATGLTVYGAVAKSATPDCSTATKITSNENLDMSALYVMGVEHDSKTKYFYKLDSKWARVSEDYTTNAPYIFNISGTADELAIKCDDGYVKGQISDFAFNDGKTTIVLTDEGLMQYATTTETYRLAYNHNNSSGGIRWYKTSSISSSSYPLAYLYKVALSYEKLTIDPQPDHVRTGLTYDKAGTICLPYAVKAEDYKGASIWSIESRTGSEDLITSITLVKEVDNEGHKKDLVAGKPYIFFAEESEFALFYSGEEYTGNTSVWANGLIGNLNVDDIVINAGGYQPGSYLINQNKLMECGANCYVGQYRAYVKAAQIGAGEPLQAPVMAPRRVIGNPNVAPTRIDNLNEDAWVNMNGAHKFFLNGNIVILNEGKLYNAQGQLVK